jgi:hypothetical protein
MRVFFDCIEKNCNKSIHLTEQPTYYKIHPEYNNYMTHKTTL